MYFSSFPSPPQNKTPKAYNALGVLFCGFRSINFCWQSIFLLFIPNQIHKSIIVNYANKSKLQNKIAYVGRKAIFWGKYDETEYLKSTYYKKRMKQDFYKYIAIRNIKNNGDCKEKRRVELLTFFLNS